MYMYVGVYIRICVYVCIYVQICVCVTGLPDVNFNLLESLKTEQVIPETKRTVSLVTEKKFPISLKFQLKFRQTFGRPS